MTFVLEGMACPSDGAKDVLEETTKEVPQQSRRPQHKRKVSNYASIISSLLLHDKFDYDFFISNTFHPCVRLCISHQYFASRYIIVFSSGIVEKPLYTDCISFTIYKHGYNQSIMTFSS